MCKSLLNDGEKLRAKNRRHPGWVIEVPSAHWGYPYVANVDSELRSKFQRAYQDLVVGLCGPASGDNHRGEALFPGGDRRGGYCYVILDGAAREALVTLYESVQEIAKEAFQLGLIRGRGFIAGLCSGSVSLEELNDATVATDD